MTSLRIPQVLASLLVLTSSTLAFAQSNNTERSLPTQQQLSRFGLERAWWGQAVLNPAREKVRHVSMDEDMVYVLSTGGVATAFDAETGKKRWALNLGRHDQPSYPIVSNENLAMAVVGSTLYGIQKTTGRVIWTLDMPAQPSTSPGVDENQVYIGTLDGSVYAYSLRKIRTLFQEQRLPKWSAEAMVWRSSAAKEITSSPIPSGRTVSYASRDGSLYNIATADKQLIYQLETNGAIVAPIATNGKVHFLASEDYTLFALDALNGRIIWDFTAGLPIRRAPFVIDNDLYVAPDRGGMFCMNAAEGTKRWWQPSLTNFIAVVGNSIYASDLDGNLVRASREDGGISAALPMRGFSVRVANDRTDRIYMSTESGLIIGLRKRGETIPVFHKYPDRLPIIPEITPEVPAAPEAAPDAAPEAAPDAAPEAKN
ncbi:MAG: PQQ-binding-like beta-propeller repeat protein [Planctomycetaceae bacterium]